MSKNKILVPVDRRKAGQCSDVIHRAPPRARAEFSNPLGMRLIHCLAKPACTALIILLAACGGSLTDEQRKKLHEGMEDHKITQVSDNEIVTAAMDEGRRVFDTLEKSHFDIPTSQRIARERKVKVRFITPGTSDALEVENQIIQAYIVGSVTGATQDNIQKLRSGTSTDLQDYDTLLYSRPIVTSQPDGSVNVDGVWNIYLAKRDIVRSLSKK
ncbi:MAG TPA: hypothetical protein VK658_01210 [Chryseolinea sp.]|nr:hypothetical protein [Chryseolinea sp.]